MKDINSLLEALHLEQIEENIYRGASHSTGGKRVFGGQVLAQALKAATLTVPKDRIVHSLHGYFILPGDVKKPIIYDVDRIRDGGSFTTRRVVAIQNGRAIFNSSASFQIREEGLDHQIAMPNVPHPDNLMNAEGLAEAYKKHLPQEVINSLLRPRPIEFRPVEKPFFLNPGKGSPYSHVWMRANGKMPADDVVAHRTVLAYASDYNLLSTALQPHGVTFSDLIAASLDHAMWFHRDFNADEWLLYALDTPSASNARGFTRGNIFDQSGRLIASVTQEGLIRQRRAE